VLSGRRNRELSGSPETLQSPCRNPKHSRAFCGASNWFSIVETLVTMVNEEAQSNAVGVTASLLPVVCYIANVILRLSCPTNILISYISDLESQSNPTYSTNIFFEQHIRKKKIKRHDRYTSCSRSPSMSNY
jgi:hypothetical protein